MRAPLLASTLAIGAVAIGVAACGSNSSSTTNSGSSASTTPSSGRIVNVDSVDGMKVLAGPSGKTLYTASTEQGGKIKCVGSCTSIWSPELATPAAAKQAASQLGTSIGVVTRPDGKQQLTFKGMPLYSFTQEGTKALQGNGAVDSFSGTQFHWQAASTSGNTSSTMPTTGGGYSSGGGGY
jgi:predicted lipoprotein with Yx(FWY)xxD motif